MDVLLDHRPAGRRPRYAAAILVAAGGLGLAVAQHSPPMLWAIWLAGAGVLGATFMLMPPSGSRIDQDTWQSFRGNTRRIIPLDEIREVELRQWHDGPDTCRVHMWDGRVLTVPGPCLPQGEILATSLRRAGVSVRRN